MLTILKTINKKKCYKKGSLNVKKTIRTFVVFTIYYTSLKFDSFQLWKTAKILAIQFFLLKTFNFTSRQFLSKEYMLENARFKKSRFLQFLMFYSLLFIWNIKIYKLIPWYTSIHTKPTVFSCSSTFSLLFIV